MQVEILVEEPSAEEALRHLIPKIFGTRTRFAIRNMGSKSKLLRKLPQRLKAYSARIQRGESLRIIVLVDQDSQDCQKLKNVLEQAATEAGLGTKSRPDTHGLFQVVNRIAIEELEAWFIGDPNALRAAFTSLPKIPAKGIFRNPDNISGGTWESLHRFLKKNGIYKSSYPKIEAARKIAPHLSIHNNRSKSFQVFRSGVEEVIGRKTSSRLPGTGQMRE